MKNIQNKDNKNDSEKKIENIQPKFMLTTPIFFILMYMCAIDYESIEQNNNIVI